MEDPEFFNLNELEKLAREKLPKMVFDYYAGGAETGFSIEENREAFQRWRLLPRMLVNVSQLDTKLGFLGLQFSFPVMVAPMAMQRMAHKDGEVAMARAAAAAGVPMAHSTVSTSSLGEVAATSHPGLIYQLYVVRNRKVVRAWVEEAERLGYRALMVTVDAQRLGRREADERNRFRLPDGLSLKTVEALRGDSVTQARQNLDGSGLGKLFASEVDDGLTWEFIPWLRSITKLPIMLKGLLAPDDVVLALHHGVDAIVVSNHGGRQMDYAPAGLDMLPAIARVVAGRVPLLVDGGVRRGTDVLKALALGADAVLLGRPLLYALALGGQAGVEKALRLLREELELAMALAGCPSLRNIGPHLLLPSASIAAAPPQQADIPRPRSRL